MIPFPWLGDACLVLLSVVHPSGPFVFLTSECLRGALPHKIHSIGLVGWESFDDTVDR